MSENQATDYGQTPSEQHSRWVMEFAAARKALEGWQRKGDAIDAEFRNEVSGDGEFDTRLPLFASDTQTVIALLYGQVPKATVTRRFGDSGDDRGRVAGTILERILNADISKDNDTYAVALGCSLMDFFLPGFALPKLRYVTGEIERESVAAEMGPDGKELVEAYVKESRPKEDVEVDYAHWKDWLWGPARVPHEVPWWAHCSDMTRKKLVERFGAKGKLVPLQKRKDGSEDPWSRAKVWEIYEKEERKVYWFCESYDELLDTKEDPLKLEGFYPFPEPLIANLTTSKVVPRPFYALHQDQYKQINVLMSRIRELVDAVRVTGAYDKSNEDIPKMLLPEWRSKLIPIKNWGALSEKGGIRGAVDWFPLDMVVQAIAVLQQQLVSEIDLLRQATGYSDIMRGEATQAGATATEQRAKTRFGSVRIQKLQDQIAKFATDILRIKGEIVAKHFDPATIMARANVRFMPEADQAIAMEAIALLKSDYACYRIEVKPEAVALADFAAQKAERVEVLGALTQFFQAMAPIAAQAPGATPHLLKMAQWMVAGVRGASQIEGVFDQMVQAAEQAAKQAAASPQQAPPDPKVEAEKMKQQTVQMKGQLDIARDNNKAQLQQQQTMNDVQADAMREANQRTENVKEAAQRQAVANMLKPPAPPGRNGGFP